MDGERTTDLRKALDPRKSVDPKNVEGTGKVYAHTMWLNLAERWGTFLRLLMHMTPCTRTV